MLPFEVIDFHIVPHLDPEDLFNVGVALGIAQYREMATKGVDEMSIGLMEFLLEKVKKEIEEAESAPLNGNDSDDDEYILEEMNDTISGKISAYHEELWKIGASILQMVHVDTSILDALSEMHEEFDYDPEKGQYMELVVRHLKGHCVYPLTLDEMEKACVVLVTYYSSLLPITIRMGR